MWVGRSQGKLLQPEGTAGGWHKGSGWGQGVQGSEEVQNYLKYLNGFQNI